MTEPSVVDSMRAEWNARAKEDANYYVAFGRRQQSEEEFLASAADVIRALRTEMKRRPDAYWKAGAALEIGCGPGRLMQPLSALFREIHGVDVSDEMVRRASVTLRDVANAHAHHTENSTLRAFGGATFDFVYSYAVFQHIPRKQVVIGYLEEALRVMKPGALFVFQISGLPDCGHQSSTWDGARFAADEIIDFAARTGSRLLALNDRGTQYMWVTIEKPDPLQAIEQKVAPHIRRLSNAHTGEPLIPARGRFGAMSIWIEGLPATCDLLNLTVQVDGEVAELCYLSALTNGLQFVNAIVPSGTRTGLVPVELAWNGKPLCAPAWARVTGAAPRVPRVVSLTDGVDLLSTYRISSGWVKVVIEELEDPTALQASIGGVDAAYEHFCVNAFWERHEFNLRIPEHLPKGAQTIEMSIAGGSFAPVPVEIA